MKELSIKRLNYFFSLFILCSFNKAYGQCGVDNLYPTPDYYTRTNEQIQPFLDSKQDRSTLIVPVVFHIIYRLGEENIPDSLIYQQIERLNLDFQRMNSDTSSTPAPFQSTAAGMDVIFCLAQVSPEGEATSGILRIETEELSFETPDSYAIPDPVKHTTSGGSDAWETSEYLNIWICNLTGSTAYTAPFGNFASPDDDGIVCHYNYVGNAGFAPYDLGRTMVHEAGHWFGLKHIWGDDGGSCEGTDFMPDTPNQGNWTGGCPSFPHTDACTPDGDGVMFMNYMDYSRDSCRNMFTNDQVNYMNAFIDAIIPSYYDQDNCTSPTMHLNETLTPKTVVFIQGAQLTIHSEQFLQNVEVYTLSGRLVHSTETFQKEVTLPISQKGIYLVKIHYAKNEQDTFHKIAHY